MSREAEIREKHALIAAYDQELNDIIRQRDAMKAELEKRCEIIAAVHEAIGEHPASDDDTLANGVRLRIVELKAELECAAQLQKDEAALTVCVLRLPPEQRERLAKHVLGKQWDRLREALGRAQFAIHSEYCGTVGCHPECREASAALRASEPKE